MRQVPRSPLSFKLQRVANVPEHPPPSTRLMSCAHIANRRLSRIIGARSTTQYGAPASSCAEIATNAPRAWGWGKTERPGCGRCAPPATRGIWLLRGFHPISGLFISQFVTPRRPMCFESPKAAARKQSRVWRVRWLKFSMKSCCIPAWPRSSRGLSCSRRRPGSAKAVIKFRVGARRRRWLAPAARTCRIDPYVLRCGASKCPDEVATAV